jgi:hypothetical protein
MQRKLLGIVDVDLDIKVVLLIKYSAFIKYLGKNWECSETVHQLFVDLKKVCDSVWREVLYNILIEFGIP